MVKGVMIDWHVEKHATCIYSQLKTCSSSEVAAMIKGVLRHYNQMKVEKQFVDTHGHTEQVFARASSNESPFYWTIFAMRRSAAAF